MRRLPAGRESRPRCAVVVEGAKCQAPTSPLRWSAAMNLSNRTPPDRTQAPGPRTALNVVGSHASFILTSRSEALGRPQTCLLSSSRAQPVALFSCESMSCSSDFSSAAEFLCMSNDAKMDGDLLHLYQSIRHHLLNLPVGSLTTQAERRRVFFAAALRRVVRHCSCSSRPALFPASTALVQSS